MKLKLVPFGIAKEILDKGATEYELDVQNIGELRAALFRSYPELAKLRSLMFAVNEEYQVDEFILTENVEVVIIPPVAGG